MGLGTQKKNNDEGSDNCDRCCKLGAGDKIADVYHACKYRSIWIAVFDNRKGLIPTLMLVANSTIELEL